MGRREPDERPPIEVLGADLGVSSTQQVAVGPRRKPGRRHRSLAIAGVVGVLLVGGFAIGGSDDGDGDEDRVIEDERDNRARDDLASPLTSTTVRRSTTTSSTTTVPAGPPLGRPVEGALVLYSANRWQVVDLETGEIYDLTLPSSEPYNSAATHRGIVVTVDGVARFHPILGTGPEPKPLDLGPADVVMPAGPGRVWLIDSPPEGANAPNVTSDVRLVDTSGDVLRSFQIPGRWVSDATADAVVLSRGGRVYAADGDGVRAIATGWSVGTNGDAAVVATCDEAARCTLERQPVDGGPSTVIADVGDPDSQYLESFEGPAGELALLISDPTGADQELRLFAPDGGGLGTVEIEIGSVSTGARWLPDDLGLLVGTNRGVEWVRPDGKGWSMEPLDLDEGRRAEFFFVVTP